MKRGLLLLISLMVSFLSMGQHFSYEANNENKGFKIRENKASFTLIAKRTYVVVDDSHIDTINSKLYKLC